MIFGTPPPPPPPFKKPKTQECDWESIDFESTSRFHFLRWV